MEKVIIIFFIIISFIVRAQHPSVESSAESDLFSDSVQGLKNQPLTCVSPWVYEIGGVIINKGEEFVEFPAVVNMDRGLLEYLIVGKEGKVHESLLCTKIEPYNLQIALLLLGFKGTTTCTLIAQGYSRKPEGDKVQIWIQWHKEGEKQKHRIEDWVRNKNKNSSMKPTDWIFTGSFVYNGTFMAQLEQSIVAVYRDPAAMIDNPWPEGTSDEIWFVNEQKVPHVGTGVIVVVEKKRSEKLRIRDVKK